VLKFTYEKCKTTHTPGGTFKVPDQVTVVHVYETSATTHSYDTEADYDRAKSQESTLDTSVSGSYGGAMVSMEASASFSMASSSSSNAQGQSVTSVGVRSIDLNLYALHMETAAPGLEQAFLDDLTELPKTFTDGPHKYLAFLRRYGRFVVKGANYGGSIKLIMKYTQTAESYASTSDSAWGAAVSMKMDTITVGVEASMEASGSKAAADQERQMEADSRISLECSGGDPVIAAAVSDFRPGPDSATQFRNDLQMWLPSVAKFPALVTDVPRLEYLHEVVPDATALDRMRRSALEYGESVISVNPWLAMHPTEKKCKGQGWKSLDPQDAEADDAAAPAGPDFRYDDFDRIRQGFCLSFRAKTSGALYVSLSGVPTQKDGRVVLTFGTMQTSVSVWQRDETRSSPSHLEGNWVNILRTAEPVALATGSKNLIGEYWVCVRNSDEAAAQAGQETERPESSELSFGIGRRQVFRKVLVPRIHPSFFSLGCQNDARISGIMVTPFKDFESFVDRDLSVTIQSVCPRIPGCRDERPSLEEEGCFCRSGCIADLYEPLHGDAAAPDVVTGCRNIGCQPRDQPQTVASCNTYAAVEMASAADCTCEKVRCRSRISSSLFRRSCFGGCFAIPVCPLQTKSLPARSARQDFCSRMGPAKAEAEATGVRSALVSRAASDGTRARARASAKSAHRSPPRRSRCQPR
jgi:hypothetical protein